MRAHARGGLSWWAAVLVGLGAGGVVGLINGFIIAYLGLSPFVTTLGMLAIARSVAVVLSGNRMIYKFGPGGADVQDSGRRRARARPIRSRCPIRCCS